MSEPNAAGRKTDNALEAVVELMKERIDIQKARLAQPETQPPAHENAAIAELKREQQLRTRVPGDGVAPEEALMPSAQVDLAPEMYQPESTKALLNAQLLECVALMRDAGWLYRNSRLEPHDRGYFVDQAVHLMEASTKMGEAIRRLVGGEDPVPTTRHVMVVQHEEGGGGKASLENE